MSFDNSSRISSCLFVQITSYTNSRPYVIATCVLNGLFCVPNIIGSTVIVLTMRNNPHLGLPSHVHLQSIAVADLITGLVVQPLFVLHKIAWLYGLSSLDCIARVMTELVAWTSASMTCLTVSFISLDRMLAIQLHMKYELYVTRRKTLTFTIGVWIFVMLASFSRFLFKDWEPFVIIVLVVMFGGNLIVFIAYGKIYQCMKHHHKQISLHVQPVSLEESTTDGNSGPGKVIQIKALWKSAINLAYVVALYEVTYLPLVGCLIACLVYGQTLYIEIAYDITRTFIFCASVLNPVLYCWKIKDIRVEVEKTLERFREGILSVNCLTSR